VFADDDVDEAKNDSKKKKTSENFRERDDMMRVLSFFLPMSSKSCFCRLSSLFLFVRLTGLSNEENSSFWYDFTRVDVNVNVVGTKKNSFSVCAKAGSFSHLPDDCSLCAIIFSWLFSLERSRCLYSI
jgi:hypothetical protein